MHDWTVESPRTAREWGLTVFPPDALRASSDTLLRWIHATNASKLAIHFDVDTIDAAEVRLGLGEDFGGLTTTQARRVVADIEQAAEVVAITVAEYVPRQVIQLQQLLAGFPLLSD